MSSPKNSACPVCHTPGLPRSLFCRRCGAALPAPARGTGRLLLAAVAAALLGTGLLGISALPDPGFQLSLAAAGLLSLCVGFGLLASAAAGGAVEDRRGRLLRAVEAAARETAAPRAPRSGFGRAATRD